MTNALRVLLVVCIGTTLTQRDALADREHFIVAYPQAFERSWADGRNDTSAEKQGVDDVGFAKAVIEDITTKQTLDRSRVFATGLSNGAIFIHRLACEAADTFAAIAPVLGAVAKITAASCRPRLPVAVVAVQGRADLDYIWTAPSRGGWVRVTTPPTAPAVSMKQFLPDRPLRGSIAAPFPTVHTVPFHYRNPVSGRAPPVLLPGTP